MKIFIKLCACMEAIQLVLEWHEVSKKEEANRSRIGVVESTKKHFVFWSISKTKIDSLGDLYWKLDNFRHSHRQPVRHTCS